MQRTIAFSIVFMSALMVGCTAYFAVTTAPEKKPHVDLTETRDKATQLFWKTFHAGSYSDIPKALMLLKAEYLNNPNDPQLPLYIAHLHFWRIAERFRLQDNITPDITDDLTIAIKYFSEAKKLNPEDARIDGWLAGARMSQAIIHNDEKDKRSAYYQGLKSIKDYPEFNYFSIGYVFSNLGYDSENFSDAINWYFNSMDIAYHTKVDRNNPDIAPYLHLEQKESNQQLKKAVWNSQIAPHNLEGFYLNFGDFLVKSGQVDRARIIYNNARLVPGYSRWPYRFLLENRLKNIHGNVESFRASTNQKSDSPEETVHKRMIFNSYNCMVCHQASG